MIRCVVGVMRVRMLMLDRLVSMFVQVLSFAARGISALAVLPVGMMVMLICFVRMRVPDSFMIMPMEKFIARHTFSPMCYF